MINFGALPQPSTTFAAAPCLQAPQEPYVITRRGPKLPSDHACAVPDRILVGPSLPQIDMPAEAINWLPANTTKAGTLRIRAFPKGRRWIPGMSPATRPCGRRPAASSSRWALRYGRQARARRSARSGCAPQYEFIASRGVGGTNGRLSARERTTIGNVRGKALVRRASERRFRSSFSSCHLDIVGPPGNRRHSAIVP